MNGSTISWLLSVTVKDGQLENFRSLMKEMVKSTKANEPGALIYEWFISEDGKTIHLYERYQDSEAVMTHLSNFGEHFAQRFLNCVNISSMDVYGEPNEEVRKALTAQGATFLGSFGGFVR